MPKTIDLPRIRRALSELDRIAAEHPELCQHQGQWDEKEVEEMIMGTPAKERVAQLRARREAQGIKRITFFCDPNAQTALLALRKEQPDLTVDATICAALIAAVTEPPVIASLPAIPAALPLFQPDSTDGETPPLSVDASPAPESAHPVAKPAAKTAKANHTERDRLIMELHGQGVSYRQIAARLAAQGHLSAAGTPLSIGQIGRVLERTGLKKGEPP